MAKWKVAICLDEGVSVEVEAEDEVGALKKAYTIVEEHGGTEYPKEYKQDVLHRDFFTQDATLIGEE